MHQQRCSEGYNPIPRIPSTFSNASSPQWLGQGSGSALCFGPWFAGIIEIWITDKVKAEVTFQGLLEPVIIMRAELQFRLRLPPVRTTVAMESTAFRLFFFV
jgi:hypothetical protein